MTKDFQKLEGDANEFISRFQEAFDLAREFESKYRELPSLLSAKDAFDKEKAELFEEEAKIAMEEMQRLVQELNDVEKRLKGMREDVEQLKDDLNNDRDVLKEAAVEVEEEFDINTWNCFRPDLWAFFISTLQKLIQGDQIISITRQDFTKTDREVIEDFEALEEDIRKIPKEFEQILKIFKDLKPKYDDIPSTIDELEAFNERKAEQFEEDAGYCSDMIEDLRDELDAFKENLLDIAGDVEELNEDFENEQKLLDKAAEEADEDFKVSRDHQHETDQ